MSDLVERIEAAEGSSRELDAEIFLAVYSRTWRPRHINDECPAFTSSLDAALSLVPEGWGFSLSRSENRLHSTAALGRSYPTNKNTYGESATPALALCAAALRAREASDEG